MSAGIGPEHQAPATRAERPRNPMSSAGGGGWLACSYANQPAGSPSAAPERRSWRTRIAPARRRTLVAARGDRRRTGVAPAPRPEHPPSDTLDLLGWSRREVSHDIDPGASSTRARRRITPEKRHQNNGSQALHDHRRGRRRLIRSRTSVGSGSIRNMRACVPTPTRAPLAHDQHAEHAAERRNIVIYHSRMPRRESTAERSPTVSATPSRPSRMRWATEPSFARGDGS